MGQIIKHSVGWRNSRLALCLGALLALTAVSALSPAAAQESRTLYAATSQFSKESWEPWLSPTGETPVINAVGETLLAPDPKTGGTVGNLVETWSISPDLKTWTFKLRPNIPFHDGWGTVTAEDVKYSWAQFIREEATVNLAGTYRQAVDGKMDNFVVKGPLEFELRTTKPVVFLESAISSVSNAAMKVQSKAYWEKDPKKALTHPIGTGPYRFVRYNPGVEVELEAVENHWRKTAAFKKVVLKVIDDDSARLAQVASGQLDIAALAPRLLGEAKSHNLQIFGVPEAGNVNIIFGGWYPGIGDPALGESAAVRNNPKGAARYDRNAPWIQADHPEKGRAIREALSLAIDRQALLDVVMSGRGKLLTAPFTQFPSNPALTDPAWKVPPYDPDRARKLLAEGGYPTGLEITVAAFEWQDRAFTVDISEAVAGMWEAIGVKVKRQRTDYEFYRQIAGTRTSAGYAFPIVANYYVEAAQGFSATFMPTSGSARLYDPSIIAAVNAMNNEPDQAKRFKITHDLLGHLRDEVIGIPLFTYEAPFVASSKLTAWQPTVGDASLSNFESMVPAK